MQSTFRICFEVSHLARSFSVLAVNVPSVAIFIFNFLIEFQSCCRISSFRMFIKHFRLVWATFYARPPSLRWPTWSSCCSRGCRPSRRRTFRSSRSSRWETPDSRQRQSPDAEPSTEPVKPETMKAGKKVTEKSRLWFQQLEAWISRSRRRSCRSPCQLQTPSRQSTLSKFSFCPNVFFRCYNKSK